MATKAGKKEAVKAEEEKASHKAEKKEKPAEKKEKPEAEEKEAEKPKAEEKPAKEEKAGRKQAEKEKPARKEEAEEKHAEKREPTRKHEHAGREEHAERRHRKEKPKKGKALRKENFVELKPAELTEAILHLANEGHSASEIGMILRDQYGIPKVSKVTGKKLAAILQENKLLPHVPEDLMNLIRKSVALRDHLAKNNKDMSAKHGLILTVSKIRALEKYYKQKGKLPMQWRYSPETAALLAK